MLDLIKIDIKNCLKNIRFQISFLCLLGVSLLAFWGVCAANYNESSLYLESTNKLGIIQGVSVRNMFQMLLLTIPVLASVMYSDSYIYEKNENISNYFFARTSKTKYFLSKIIVVFLVVFMSIFITLVLNELLTWIAIPNIGVYTAGAQEYASPKYDNSFFMPSIYNSYPYLYNIIISAIFALYGALIAVIAFNISLLVKMKSITLHIFTLLIVQVIFFVVPERFALEMYIQSWNGTFKDFIITVLAWICIAIITGIVGIWKECKS